MKIERTLKWMFGFLFVLLVACGGTQGTEPAVQSGENAPIQPAVEEAILPVAAKPQLIEFYADW